MTFRSLILFFCLFCRSEFFLQIVAIIWVTLVLGSKLLMVHWAVMALVIQFATVACLGHLVVLHYFVHLAPGLMEAIVQRMGTHHIPGE